MPVQELTINMEIPCKRCGKMGATDKGLCLRCLTNDIQHGKYRKLITPNNYIPPTQKKEGDPNV